MPFATPTALTRLLGVALGAVAISIAIACGVEVEATPSATMIPSPTATPQSTATPEPERTPLREEAPVAQEMTATTYLTGTVEPCAPVDGSDVDPCERRDGYDIHSFHSANYTRPIPPLTLAEGIRTINRTPDWSPHLAVRAVALPGTTRCARSGSLGLYGSVGGGTAEFVTFHCFLDFSVRNYIVGRGPERLTIRVTTGLPEYLERVDWDDEAQVEQHIVSKVAEEWEGYEWAMYLAPFVWATSETWQHLGATAVQRLEGGEIAAMRPDGAQYKRLVERGDMDEEYLSRVITPLEEYERNIRDAIAILGGRVAGGDPNRPLLLQDANAEFLHEFFVARGVYDHPVLTPAPPPPAPGGDDPVGSGVPSNEGGTSGEGSAPGDPTPAAGN